MHNLNIYTSTLLSLKLLISSYALYKLMNELMSYALICLYRLFSILNIYVLFFSFYYKKVQKKLASIGFNI